PELANLDRVMDLWFTRMRVLGVAQALTQRFVESGSANWCYGLGVTLGDGDEIMDRLELSAAERASFPSEALESLSTRYYERAMLRFEAFFSTGEGNVRDGDIHVYAMNCNNLAGVYRYSEHVEKALDLYTKGFDASPFAELLDGAMHCQNQLERYPEHVQAAERLWHYSIEEGYGRHKPSAYFGGVAWSLQHLGRSAEIEIWLDRLRQARQELDNDDRQGLSDLWGSEAALLEYLHAHKAGDSVARMNAIHDDLVRVGDTWALTRLGQCFTVAGEPQKALPLFERAVAAYNAEQYGEDMLKRAQAAAVAAHIAIRKQKPFWRRWL
ncbi:MAG: hypothetical protein ACTS5V_11985, partial [Giesbergeria sp.]